MEDEKQFYTIILRHDTSSSWMQNDPILALGEYGVEDDTHRVKRGDGINPWSSLMYETFGLKFIVTYANLSGDITDNADLSEALNNKVSISVFGDNTKIVSGISIMSDEGAIGKITKVLTDLKSGASSVDTIIIKSSDNTISGVWSIDTTGARILDLHHVAKIDEFQMNHIYAADEFCMYNNKIYKSKEAFTSVDTFNPDNWILVTSLNSKDLIYDPSGNDLAAQTVQGAIDEVVDRLAVKVNQTNLPDKVYCTNQYGDQQIIDKDALRKVDTVNNIQPDALKNVQIDSSKINYDDSAEIKRTIKQVLDSKVDMTIAGQDGTVVTDVTTGYDETQGVITLTTQNLSLVTGNQTQKTQTLNVVSDTELANAKTELEQLIEQTKTDLKHNIDINDGEINGRVTSEVATLNSRIDSEVATLNSTITEAQNTINERIDSEVATLNSKITQASEEANNNLTQGLSTKIDKDIADALVSSIIVSQVAEDSVMEPTLQITSKNTDTKTDVIQNIHFKAVGNIATKMQDDHIIIDSTTIDKNIQDNVDHLTSVDTKILNNEKEIASLQQHDVNHESVLATHTKQIANHETRILANENSITEINNTISEMKDTYNTDITDIKNVNASQEAHLTQLDQTDTEHAQQIQANADAIVQTNKNVAKNTQDIEQLNTDLTGTIETTKTELQQNIDNLEDVVSNNKTDIENKLTEATNELTTNKLDKTFTTNLVNTLTYEQPNGAQLFNINKKDISPETNQVTNTIFTIKSSDNTLVAKPIMQDGSFVGVDLATNLDTDVNYFVTSETLSTVIPSDNTVQLSSLTATDKQTVEIQDIITDSEGTWARVKSIDNEAGTCVAVTFHKHAQAVWGTVKGDIQDQQDLQEEFATKVNTSDVLDTVQSVCFSLGGNTFRIKQKHYIPLNGNEPQLLNNNMAITFPGWLKPVSKNLVANNTWGDISFETNIDILEFDPGDTGLSKFLGLAVKQLKGFVDTNTTDITNLKNDTVNKTLNTAIQSITNGQFNKDTGDITVNYNLYDVNTDSASSQSLVIPGLFTQSDMDDKLSILKLDGSNLIAGNITISESDTNRLKIGYDVIDPTSYLKQTNSIGVFSGDTNTINITKIDDNVIHFDVNTDNITVTTPNENTKPIIKAVEDLYKLPRITSYEDLGNEFTIKPGMMVYSKDSTNNIAYIAICVTEFTTNNTEGSEQDFNTNITNGNLLRVGIPNEVI